LLEAVGRWSAGAGAGAAEEDEGEGGVKKGVQDTLSVSYLASLLRMQVELQGRLGLVQQVQQTA
jgi:translation initiation factor 3 subunit F